MTRPLEIIKQEIRFQVSAIARGTKQQPIFVIVNLLAACRGIKPGHPMEVLVTLLAQCRQQKESVN